MAENVNVNINLDCESSSSLWQERWLELAGVEAAAAGVLRRLLTFHNHSFSLQIDSTRLEGRGARSFNIADAYSENYRLINFS